MCSGSDIAAAAGGRGPGHAGDTSEYATLQEAARTLLAKADAIAASGAQPPVASAWQGALAAARAGLAPSPAETAALAAFGVRSLVEHATAIAAQTTRGRARAHALAASVVELYAAGRRGMAAALAAMTVEMAGDPTLTRVLPFLVCLEALVRARLAHDAGGEGAHSAASYWSVALNEASAPCGPGLILCCGLSGSGKSFVAGGVAASLGADVVSSDRVRKESAGLPATERTPRARVGDLYSSRVTERVYRALNDRADAELAAGRAVVLDATFLTRARRMASVAVAATRGAPAVLLWCETAAAAAKARLRERATRDWTVSDADTRIRALQAANAQPPQEGELGAVVIAVDTGVDPSALFELLLPRVREALAAGGHLIV